MMRSPEALRFRDLLISELGSERCVYLDEDRFLGTCPLCGEAVGVAFAGYAPRATLNCHGGCTEDELGEMLGLVVRP